jgi:hypothetical protein
MDEDLKAALSAAGESLALAVRAELSARGLPDDVHVLVGDGRVVIGSASRAVKEAELGRVGTPPRPSMEMAGYRGAVEALDGVAAALRRSLAW